MESKNKANNNKKKVRFEVTKSRGWGKSWMKVVKMYKLSVIR